MLLILNGLFLIKRPSQHFFLTGFGYHAAFHWKLPCHLRSSLWITRLALGYQLEARQNSAVEEVTP